MPDESGMFFFARQRKPGAYAVWTYCCDGSNRRQSSCSSDRNHNSRAIVESNCPLCSESQPCRARCNASRSRTGSTRPRSAVRSFRHMTDRVSHSRAIARQIASVGPALLARSRTASGTMPFKPRRTMDLVSGRRIFCSSGMASANSTIRRSRYGCLASIYGEVTANSRAKGLIVRRMSPH